MNKFTHYILLILSVGIAFGSAAAWGYDAGYNEAVSNQPLPKQENAIISYTTKVYTHPLVHSDVKGIIIEGDEIIVKETLCDFYKINYTDSENMFTSGWVLNSDVELLSNIRP